MLPNALPSLDKDPYCFVIAKYNRPNESFPSRLDVGVNGHKASFLDGRWCIAPWFLVAMAKKAYNLGHRDKKQGDDDTQETFRVFANIDVIEVPKEYNSPEGIPKLLAMAKGEKDQTSPYFRLYSATSYFVFGELSRREVDASDVSKKNLHAEDSKTKELESKLAEKDDQIAMLADKFQMLMAKVDSMQAPAPEVPAPTKKKSGPKPNVEDVPADGMIMVDD